VNNILKILLLLIILFSFGCEKEESKFRNEPLVINSECEITMNYADENVLMNELKEKTEVIDVEVMHIGLVNYMTLNSLTLTTDNIEKIVKDYVELYEKEIILSYLTENRKYLEENRIETIVNDYENDDFYQLFLGIESTRLQ
jgi:hypothetical protein